MSAFVNKERIKHAILLASTAAAKGRVMIPRTAGMSACVAEFLPAFTRDRTNTVSLESVAQEYEAHNDDPSVNASDMLDSQVADVVAYVKNVIETARERVVPVARQIDALIRPILRSCADIFEIDSVRSNVSDGANFDSYLEIPANTEEPTEIPALNIARSNAQICAMLHDSQLFPKEVTERFLSQFTEDTLVSYYNAFYNGNFSKVNRLFAPSNYAQAKECLIVGLMITEYFARNVERAVGPISLDLWNSTVRLMTRFCMARINACDRARDRALMMGLVVMSVDQSKTPIRVVLNNDLVQDLNRENITIEVVLGGVLTSGEDAVRLTTRDFVNNKEIYLRRFNREAPMRRLGIRAKVLTQAKLQLVNFIAREVNPKSDTMDRLRQDKFLQKLDDQHLPALASYIAANYVVGVPMAAVYLEMMETAKMHANITDPRAAAAAAAVDFLALVLASNVDCGRTEPVNVVTRIEG